MSIYMSTSCHSAVMTRTMCHIQYVYKHTRVYVSIHVHIYDMCTYIFNVHVQSHAAVMMHSVDYIMWLRRVRIHTYIHVYICQYTCHLNDTRTYIYIYFSKCMYSHTQR